MHDKSSGAEGEPLGLSQPLPGPSSPLARHASSQEEGQADPGSLPKPPRAVTSHLHQRPPPPPPLEVPPSSSPTWPGTPPPALPMSHCQQELGRPALWALLTTMVTAASFMVTSAAWAAGHGTSVGARSLLRDMPRLASTLFTLRNLALLAMVLSPVALSWAMLRPQTAATATAPGRGLQPAAAASASSSFGGTGGLGLGQHPPWGPRAQELKAVSGLLTPLFASSTAQPDAAGPPVPFITPASDAPPPPSPLWNPGAITRIISIVPSLKDSPYKTSWGALAAHSAQRLAWTDESYQMLVFDDNELAVDAAARQHLLEAVTAGCQILVRHHSSASPNLHRL